LSEETYLSVTAPSGRWGVSFGGPIATNKTFFFANYEGSNDKAIYVADMVYRGDCVRLDIDLLAGAARGAG